MEWIIFLGKLPFILAGAGFALYLAWVILVGVYGIVCMTYKKIKDLING